MAKIPNNTFGNHTATNGGKSDWAAITPNILSKNTNTMAMQMPKAKLTPMPPRRFMEDTATAIIVNINTETGKLHLRYKTSSYLPIFVDPRCFSFSMNRFKSP